VWEAAAAQKKCSTKQGLSFRIPTVRKDFFFLGTERNADRWVRLEERAVPSELVGRKEVAVVSGRHREWEAVPSSSLTGWSCDVDECRRA